MDRIRRRRRLRFVGVAVLAGVLVVAGGEPGSSIRPAVGGAPAESIAGPDDNDAVIAASPVSSVASAPPSNAAADTTLADTTLADTSLADAVVPTTEPNIPPFQPSTAPEIEDSIVRALAESWSIEGELERKVGEFGQGQCIGRLEQRGICVHVPLWGVWNFWDLDTQSGAGTNDDDAIRAASELFALLGVDPGKIEAITRDGPLPRVVFSTEATVLVAENGVIAAVTAPTSLLPGSASLPHTNAASDA